MPVHGSWSKQELLGQSVYNLNRTEEFRKVIEQVLEGAHKDGILNLGEQQIRILANPVNRDGKTEGAVLLLMK